MGMKLLLRFIIACLVSITLCTSKYKVVSTQSASSTVTLGLQYTGTEDYYVKKTSPIIKRLNFVFHAYTYNDFSFKITDAQKQRFEVPQEGVFPIDPLKNFSFPISLSAVKLQYTEDPFDFKITRKANNATLFSTYEGQLIFSDYYLQIQTQVDTQYTYGIGERFNANFRLTPGKWTIFNIDRGLAIDHGTGRQTYGFYPFYLQRQNEKLFHINYFRSSNAMDVVKEVKNNRNFLTYKVIGGILDFRFFLGEQNPQLVIQKFQLYLGRSEIPPFWSLGFHQSRYGYKNVTALENVIKKYEQNNLPLDVIWTDIDYMIDYEDFTIDQKRFPLDRMKKITDKYHYVPIIDAGIKVGDGFGYVQGRKRKVFVMDATGKQEQLGKVWPGVTTFVDFFHPNASAYWGDMLDVLYQKVKFSGIWLDMNEYANFCTGPCETPNNTGFDYANDIPYTPGSEDSIQAHTIPLNATHYGNKKQADVHAFAAFLQTHATHIYLKSKGTRPFIITRSSTLGTNKYGFHWTGDNYASFSFLKGSIPDNFLNQMWGFQMVGPDICGFDGNTTQELCSRWYQLGTLYTFARNHNSIRAIDQQPYALGEKVLKAAKANLQLRYSLLKHYYSLFVAKKGLGTIFNPLFFVFPLDNILYTDEIANTHILIGNNLLAAPILEENTTSRFVYFPAVNWTSLHTGQLFRPGTSRITGVELTDKIPLFLREGTMILTQNVSNVRQTKDLDNNFTLIASFRLDSSVSNSTHKYYSAFGSHISISDYNNDAKIDQCISQNCEYTFSLLLASTSNVRTLSINVTYVGQAGLSQLLCIDKVTIHYNGDSVTNSLVSPIEIKGTQTKIVIPINDENDRSQNQRRHSVQEE